jgi:hypothetical protein
VNFGDIEMFSDLGIDKIMLDIVKQDPYFIKLGQEI